MSSEFPKTNQQIGVNEWTCNSPLQYPIYAEKRRQLLFVTIQTGHLLRSFHDRGLTIRMIHEKDFLISSPIDVNKTIKTYFLWNPKSDRFQQNDCLAAMVSMHFDYAHREFNELLKPLNEFNLRSAWTIPIYSCPRSILEIFTDLTRLWSFVHVRQLFRFHYLFHEAQMSIFSTIMKHAK